MKSNFPRIKLAKLCGWFGITRQHIIKTDGKELRQVLKKIFIEGGSGNP